LHVGGHVDRRIGSATTLSIKQNYETVRKIPLRADRQSSCGLSFTR
jgi:hypothetical protein